MTLDDIKSSEWSISLGEVGGIKQGMDDINQCIEIILTTIPGTDPLRPTFGSNIYKYIDKPLNIAIPNIYKAIIDALALWEKRIEIESLQYQAGVGELKFMIKYKLANSVETGKTILTYGLA
jgi:uncharacterized protein